MSALYSEHHLWQNILKFFFAETVCQRTTDICFLKVVPLYVDLCERGYDKFDADINITLGHIKKKMLGWFGNCIHMCDPI